MIRARVASGWPRVMGALCASVLAWALIGGGQALATGSTSYFKALTGGSPWLVEARQGAAAATLPDGKVLIVGGENLSRDLSSAELFNPATDTFTELAGGSQTVGRGAVAATLANGQVLIAGGEKSNALGASSSAELFNPTTDTFTQLTATLTEPRFQAVAATLPNGQVLIAGGSSSTARLSSAELFNPTTDTFTKLPSALTEARWGAVAAALPNGQVLIAGGESSSSYTGSTSAELFNPTTDTFTKLPSALTEAHLGAVAAALPNGQVLIAGEAASGGSSSAELFNPATNTFTKLKGTNQSPAEPREAAVAAALPGGQVLIAGGRPPGDPLNAVSTAELFSPSTDTFTRLQGGGKSLGEPRSRAVAATLPNGQVLLAGGVGNTLGGALSSAELFNPATNSFTKLLGSDQSLTQRRSGAVAATLPNGQVLIAGGYGAGSATASSAELFNPSTDTFTKLTDPGQSLTEPREYAVAAALPNGEVLIAGGEQKERALSSAELFHPSTDTFTKLTGNGSLIEPRAGAVAATLPNGRVLVAGGVGNLTGSLSSAELFNPATNTFTKLTGAAGSLAEPREYATAAALPDGQVMIAGGEQKEHELSSAELFNPATNAFTKLTGSGQSLTEPRAGAVAAALPNGQILMAGGNNPEPVALSSMSSAELFLAAPEARVEGGTFAKVAVGKRATAVLTVQNVGAQILSINGVSFGAAHSAGFTLAADGCAHETLSLHQRCTITVAFTAPTPGTTRATLTLEDNEPQPTVVSLTAAAAGPGAAVEVLACTAKAIRGQRHKQRRCSARLLKRPVTFEASVGNVTASLKRRGRVYATGKLAHTEGALRLVVGLNRRKTLPSGTYTLILRWKTGRRTHTSHQRITLE
jgi:N-acetylneuraminic acid mutarotase